MSGPLRVRWLLPLLAILVSACSLGPPPGEARIPRDARITHRAVFIGESHHDTVGTVTLYRSKKYPVIVFGTNFHVSGTPDAVVALGDNGYRADTVLGHLLKTSGRQAYAVPPEFDIDHFNEVWLWSRRTGKPVGLARLTPLRGV